MENIEEVFIECLSAIADRNYKRLSQIIHAEATFEFPYALPSKPVSVTGKAKIIENISQRKFSSTLFEPIYIDSTRLGDVYTEIMSEETFDRSNKSYSQHLICKGSVINGQVYHYKEFNNPITRLQGLLDLDDDNIIILND